MNRNRDLATSLWSFYRAWADNNFKSIDSDGDVFRARPARAA